MRHPLSCAPPCQSRLPPPPRVAAARPHRRHVDACDAERACGRVCAQRKVGGGSVNKERVCKDGAGVLALRLPRGKGRGRLRGREDERPAVRRVVNVEREAHVCEPVRDVCCKQRGGFIRAGAQQQNISCGGKGGEGALAAAVGVLAAAQAGARAVRGKGARPGRRRLRGRESQHVVVEHVVQPVVLLRQRGADAIGDVEGDVDARGRLIKVQGVRAIGAGEDVVDEVVGDERAWLRAHEVDARQVAQPEQPNVVHVVEGDDHARDEGRDRCCSAIWGRRHFKRIPNQSILS